MTDIDKKTLDMDHIKYQRSYQKYQSKSAEQRYKMQPMKVWSKMTVRSKRWRWWCAPKMAMLGVRPKNGNVDSALQRWRCAPKTAVLSKDWNVLQREQ